LVKFNRSRKSKFAWSRLCAVESLREPIGSRMRNQRKGKRCPRRCWHRTNHGV